MAPISHKRQLELIFDALAESIMEASDEDILAEAECPETDAEHVRDVLMRAVHGRTGQETS